MTKETPNKIIHKMPTDFKMTINSDSKVKDLWTDITPLAQNEWICWVTSAKKSETRDGRIKVRIDKMSKGARRPCCWAGCPHR